MRIAYNALTLHPNTYSGIHVALRGELHALAHHITQQPENEKNTLVYYVQKNLPLSQHPQSHPRIQPRTVGFPANTRTGRILWENLRLPPDARKQHADLLHNPAYVGPQPGHPPTVLTVHDVFGVAVPAFCTRASRLHLRRRMPPALAAARRIVTPTRAVADDLLRWRNSNDPAAQRAGPVDALAEKIRVVPWGIDDRFRRVDDPVRREEVQLRHGLPPRFVLLVARAEPKKNIVHALRAFFAAVLAGGHPHRLVWVGPDGWGVERDVRRTLRELALHDRVVRLGFVPDADLPALYSMADGLLFPSLAEGFGLPVFEAMACGCPVAASPLPALVENAGRDGALWTHPTDLPAWREAIENILQQSPAVRARAAHGPRTAAALTWERHTNLLWGVYREAVL